MSKSVLMLPPRYSVEGVPLNPYLNLGGLDGIADVLVKSMSDEGTAEGLAAAGFGDAEFQIWRESSSAAPVVAITVNGGSRRDTVEAMSYLVKILPKTLTQVQATSGAAPRNMVTPVMLTPDAVPEAIVKGQLRALVVAVAGGLGLTYLAALLTDGLALSRRGRQSSQLLGPTRSGGGTPAGDQFGRTPPSPFPMSPRDRGTAVETAASSSRWSLLDGPPTSEGGIPEHADVRTVDDDRSVRPEETPMGTGANWRSLVTDSRHWVETHAPGPDSSTPAGEGRSDPDVQELPVPAKRSAEPSTATRPLLLGSLKRARGSSVQSASQDMTDQRQNEKPDAE
jgi:hypothetical protein